MLQSPGASRNRDMLGRDAELHVVGEIEVGSLFGLDDNDGLFCEVSVERGKYWLPLCRMAEVVQQTQTSYPDEAGVYVWNHPIDLHLVTTSVAGWPRLRFQVWRLDTLGRVDIVSYGTCVIPSSPGHYEFECSTWTPLGSFADEVAAAFVGNRPQLTDLDLIDRQAKERHRIATSASGNIRLSLDVVVRNFNAHGLSCSSRLTEATGKNT